MFGNVGTDVGTRLKKFINVYTKIVLIIYAIGCVVGGFLFLPYGLLLAPVAFFILYGLTWLCFAPLYAFADLVENSAKLVVLVGSNSAGKKMATSAGEKMATSAGKKMATGVDMSDDEDDAQLRKFIKQIEKNKQM